MFGATAAASSSSFFVGRGDTNYSLGSIPTLHQSSAATSSIAQVAVGHDVLALATCQVAQAGLVAAIGGSALSLFIAKRNDDFTTAGSAAAGSSTPSVGGASALRAGPPTAPKPIGLSAVTTVAIPSIAGAATAVVCTPFVASSSAVTGRSARPHGTAIVVTGSETGHYTAFEVRTVAAATDLTSAPEATVVCSGLLGSCNNAASNVLAHEAPVVCGAAAWSASLGASWIALATANRLTIFDTITLTLPTATRAPLAVLESDAYPNFTGSHCGASIVDVSTTMRPTRVGTASSSAQSKPSSSEGDDDMTSVGGLDDALAEPVFSVMWDDGTVHSIFAILGAVVAGQQSVSFRSVRSVAGGMWSADGDAISVISHGATLRPHRVSRALRSLSVTPAGEIALASYTASLEAGDIDPMTSRVEQFPSLSRFGAGLPLSRVAVADARTNATTLDGRAAGSTVTTFVASSGPDLLSAAWEHKASGGGARPLRNVATFASSISALTTLPPLPSTGGAGQSSGRGANTPGSRASHAGGVAVGRLGALDGPIAVSAADGEIHFTLLK